MELPAEARNFIVWDVDGCAEQKVKEREKILLQKHGTLGGFEAMILKWGDPNNEPVEVSPDDENGA